MCRSAVCVCEHTTHTYILQTCCPGTTPQRRKFLKKKKRKEFTSRIAVRMRIYGHVLPTSFTKGCTCYRRIWTKNIKNIVHIIHSEGKFGTTASHNGRYKLISIIRCYWYWLEKNAFNIKVLIINKFEDV